jgi:hypothetical protein
MFEPNSNQLQTLRGYLSGENERCGFILASGEIVECTNICPDPAQGFEVGDFDLDRYIDDAVATWHTHPGDTRLLSVGDYETYRGMPDLMHFIVGTDGLAAYVVDRDAVLDHALPE